MYKQRVHHGSWRRWVKTNIDFNYRSVRRYMRVYHYRAQILEKGISSVNQAEMFLRKSRGIGKTAVDADYSRIDRDLIAPIRLVRRRIKKVTYNDPENPETMELIWEELQQQAEGLLSDLLDEEPGRTGRRFLICKDETPCVASPPLTRSFIRS